MSEFFWPLDRALSNCTTVRQVAMLGVWVLHCRLRKKKMSWKEHLEGCSPNSCSKQGKLQNQIRLLKVLSSFQNHRGWRLNSPFKPLLQRCTRSAAMIFFSVFPNSISLVAACGCCLLSFCSASLRKVRLCLLHGIMVVED